MTRKILVATTNLGKVKEISSLLKDLPIDVVNLSSIDPIDEAPEDFDTFEENAISKAKYYGNHAGMPTIAEDAGLEILSLDGWPSVRSSRIASTDENRIAAVHEKIRNMSDDERAARFVSVCAYFNPENGECETFKAFCQGTLLMEPRGSNGFGYDPIFWHPGYGKTLAELTTEEKNMVSHRGQSFRALAKWLIEKITL